MSIRHTCSCGAQIKLPDTAAGRKAKCKSCGSVFRVPVSAAGNPTAAATASAAPQPDLQRGDWLSEFAQTESSAEGEPVHLLDLSPPPGQESDGRRPGLPAEQARDDRDWIVAPQRSFWADLGNSFIFFLDGGNMVMFAIVVMIAIWDSLVSFAPCFISLVGHIILGGYLCAFYMNIVSETAAGEDELPSVSVSNIVDDLVMPLLRFMGTWVLVLLPALIALGATMEGFDSTSTYPEANWALVGVLAAAGLAVWPVVVLGVALSGTLKGMLPHTAVHTIISAPLPYLAILITLAVAAAIRVIVPELPGMIGATPTLGLTLGTAVLGMAVSVYTSIVAMRVIGLFYRHYKHRFPWAAE